MNDERMGNKKILPLLIEFSVPAIIGMLVNAIYNVVDRMFIGNAPQLGAVGIAGITISYPVSINGNFINGRSRWSYSFQHFFRTKRER